MAEVRGYDAVVVGTGPGGEGAAMKLAKAGRRVAVIERWSEVGGGCTHWGTIPSKALRTVVQRLSLYRSDPLVMDPHGSRPAFASLMRAASTVVRQQVDLRQGFYDRNDVDVIVGQASFRDPHAIEVEKPDGKVALLRADHVILAPGSRPWRPADVDFSHPRVRDSDTLLDLDFTPRSVIVYGAGVIGCEYTCIFRKMQCKVDLVNTRGKLLSFLDDEIIDALAYHLRDQGVLIRNDEEAASIVAEDDGVVLTTASGKRIRADALLYAQGRVGNTEALNLPAAGLKADSRGRIPVDAHYRTAVPHVYAVGDVVGWPSLASAAYDQGRYAAAHIVDPATEPLQLRDIPTGIYTSPEISCIGRTERELTEARVPYEVGHSFFRHLARAQILGQTVGMLKLLFHRETLEILGIHCFGHSASEIIHIGQAVMSRRGPENSLRYFVNTTFNYPTMAEAYRVAALNGLNRLF